MTPGIAWDRLDDWTRAAVPLVLGRLPDWERYATTADDGTLTFTVPCPNPALGGELVLESAPAGVGEEIGGTFHTWRRDSCGWRSDEDGSDDLGISLVLDDVIDIVSDAVGFLTFHYRGHPPHTELIPLPVDDWPETDDWKSDPEPDDPDPPDESFDTVRMTLRTWSSDGDRDWPAGQLECPAGDGE